MRAYGRWQGYAWSVVVVASGTAYALAQSASKMACAVPMRAAPSVLNESPAVLWK